MISIIIPAYNHAEELKQCLASIVTQTYKDFEVIVVDDGSTPALNAGEFPISNFQFPIQFLHQEHKGGSESAQRARNLGFKHSKGEYVMFCDADVVMQSTMLEKMLSELQKSEIRNPKSETNPNDQNLKIEKLDIVSKFEIRASNLLPAYVYSGFRMGHKAMPSFPYSAERLRTMPYIHTTSLIRREAFSGWDESIKKFQDWDLYLTLLEKGYSGIWIPEILYTIIPRRYGGISLWLPGFMYKIPWRRFGIHIGAIERYHEGMRVIREKHKLAVAY